MTDDARTVKIETPQGERITYFEGEAGYWRATQEGMPDVWWLSRVASRAVDALRTAQNELESLRPLVLQNRGHERE